MNYQYFPAGNTGMGFFNLFDGIAPMGARKTIILKGGPGVGKNTLMRKYAENAENKGKRVELFRCSGDPDSLDAVRVLGDDTVIVDGTAPHIIDPVFPGVTDGIVNLGVYINKEIKSEKKILEPMFESNKYQYTLAYAYLATAMSLKKSNISTALDMYDRKKMRRTVRDIAPMGAVEKVGSVRKLFLDAITHKGKISFDARVRAANEVYTVKGLGKYLFFNEAKELLSGNNLEIFYDPVCPNLIRHIYVKELNIWFTSFDVDGADTVRTENFQKYREPDYVEFNKAQTEILVQKAVSHLKLCKKAHDDIEEVYKKYMDFEGVDREYEKLVNEEE